MSSKNKVFYGGGTLSRCRTITDLLGMEVSTFPDRYLGVQIMPGAVKYHHISNVIDKIKKQLSVWKGKMLSFQDRVVLINFVIAIYAIHNMAFYKWPRMFIMQCERVIRNFLWSGDSEVARKFVVGFDKVCSPVKEGGLSITSMAVTNRALLMKFWCSIRSSNKKWARFLWAKYTTQTGRIKQYGVNSSILPGVRLVHNSVDRNTKVLLGDGRATSLYYDVWNGNECIADFRGDNELDSTVMDNYNLIDSYKSSKGRSRIIKDLWLLALMVIRVELWHARNLADELLLCCDCAAKGNPGIAWAGVVARDANCNFIGTMSIGLGRTNNFLAELYGITVGLDWALKWVVRKILMRSDSMGGVMAFNNSNMPC
ncbi:uncharacterized protein LOC113343178 [Papaver somniferum]|uniref:uncharacterized protein LOC113343178 n=1 Tax=Papaver somniferum TaxID=3469 RepID=UPI000E7008AF|nr:uncharacterized protein LOC113343178 [Papaver somniferum]